MIIIKELSDLNEVVGEELGVSGWYQVTQQQIKKFAEATGDFQWIHLDVDRCVKESPFGTTIAHGYLVLSLLPKFFYEVVQFENTALTINYGLNKVRFTHPVAVDSFIRARFRLVDLKELDSGARIISEVIFEIKGINKPACVAESILQIVWD